MPLVQGAQRGFDRHFAAYNKACLEYFPSEPSTRTTVGAKFCGNILVEFECVAYAPGA